MTGMRGNDGEWRWNDDGCLDFWDDPLADVTKLHGRFEGCQPSQSLGLGSLILPIITYRLHVDALHEKL